VFISSNKGLCGGLNTNLFRFFIQNHSNTKGYDFVTLGKKGVSFLTQTGGNIKADFSDSASFVGIVPAVTDLITSEYIAGNYDGVELVYNEFISIMRQEPRAKSILPLTIETPNAKEEQKSYEFTIEPNVDEVFASLLPHYLENQVRDAVLQSEASLYSAQMLAMRSATDNALALVDDLTLAYNKARQEKITYEISDIITASMGLAS
jgi:F-type H+-transporting ATPase subunit gamma